MEEGHDCSTLAHERNDAKHTLQDAWKGFRAELKQLSREARDLDREAKKSKSASTMTTEARAALDGANAELNEIRAAAHLEIQELTELGQACFQEREVVEENPHITLATVTKNEDGEVTLVVQFNEAVECTGDCEDLFSYNASEDQTTAAQATDFDLDEDGKTAKVKFDLNGEDAAEDEDVEVDTATDELVFTAGTATLEDEDGNAVESETENPVDVSIETNDLVMKYREVVDQAIKDMQAVVDEITAAFAEMAEAAETAETLDDSTVTEKAAKEKEERAKDKEQRVKEKVERVKEVKEKKSNANNGKGKGKGRG